MSDAVRVTIAKISFSIARYTCSVIQVPFLFALFFLVLFIITTVFRSAVLQDWVMGIFLWPLFAVFHYPGDLYTESFKPILSLAAFWALAIEVGWSIVRYLAKKRGVHIFTSNRLLGWALPILLIIALASLSVANNVSDKGGMAIIVIVTAIVGEVSYLFSLGMRKVIALGEENIT